MNDFTFYSPTKFVFGKNTQSKAGQLCREYGATHVLIVYGGESARKSGLLQQVQDSLAAAGLRISTLGGVQPNPRVSLVRTGISMVREKQIDFILAVGGGSVIDTAKGIGIGANYEHDVWDFFLRTKNPDEMLPVGVVLTIAASGSEGSPNCVLTNEALHVKSGCMSDCMRPRFAILNPELTYTLPPYQTACGITDIMMHTMERYFSLDDDMDVTDGIAESILRTVKETAPVVLAHPSDYHARAQIMWAGSLAHNDLTGCGTTGDWATHMLEHELSGMFDVAHGAGLAAVWGSWARYVLHENPTRFARFAVNVMGVRNDFKSAERTALAGIEAMEAFYRSIGMPTSIHELIGREITDDEISRMAEICSNGGTQTIGALKVLGRSDMENIYKMAK